MFNNSALSKVKFNVPQFADTLSATFSVKSGLGSVEDLAVCIKYALGWPNLHLV